MPHFIGSGEIFEVRAPDHRLPMTLFSVICGIRTAYLPIADHHSVSRAYRLVMKVFRRLLFHESRNRLSHVL